MQTPEKDQYEQMSDEELIAEVKKLLESDKQLNVVLRTIAGAFRIHDNQSDIYGHVKLLLSATQYDSSPISSIDLLLYSEKDTRNKKRALLLFLHQYKNYQNLLDKITPKIETQPAIALNKTVSHDADVNDLRSRVLAILDLDPSLHDQLDALAMTAKIHAVDFKEGSRLNLKYLELIQLLAATRQKHTQTGEVSQDVLVAIQQIVDELGLDLDFYSANVLSTFLDTIRQSNDSLTQNPV